MVPTQLSPHAEEAAALEAEARSDGDDAPALLIEAAHQWRLSGDHERCRSLLNDVVALGGTYGCFARAQLIGMLLEQNVAAAQDELAALAEDPALTDGPCQIVAEMLTDSGALAAALPWYDRAVAHWDSARRAAAAAPTGRNGADQALLAQRRRVRKRLGLGPDDLDSTV